MTWAPHAAAHLHHDIVEQEAGGKVGWVVRSVYPYDVPHALTSSNQPQERANMFEVQDDFSESPEIRKPSVLIFDVLMHGTQKLNHGLAGRFGQ